MKRNETKLKSEVLATARLAENMQLLELDGVNVIGNVDDMMRGEVAGYNFKTTGVVRELFPRMSQRDYEAYRIAQVPEVEGAMQDLIDQMTGLSNKTKLSLMGGRRVVRVADHDGGTRYAVVPTAPMVGTELDLLDYEQGDHTQANVRVPTAEQLATRQRVKEYSLTQFFTDADIATRFSLPVRVMETAKRQAITDPAAAAAIIQNYLNGCQDVLNVKITAPKGSRSKSLASTIIKTVGSEYERREVSVQADIEMNKLVMYGPGGVNDWCVRGPLRYATEVVHVYWIMYHAGRVIPNIVFSSELVLLGIDVFDGESLQEPELRFHAGPGDVAGFGLSSSTTSMLSATKRLELESFVDRMVPVMSSQGAQLATAVQVTGKHAIINAHVLSVDSRCTVSGTVPYVKQHLSRDLLCVESFRDAPPWVLRSPVLNELVTICYMVNGDLSCTAPIHLVSQSEDTLVLSMDSSVGPGVSGGAVVAIADMALLGIHCGATRNNLLAYKFGQTQFAHLLEGDSVAAVSRVGDPGEFAAKVANFFEQKGLTNFFHKSLGCLEPVYVEGVHVGTAVHDGDKLYTTCDPRTRLTFGSDRRSLILDQVPGGELFHAVDAAKVGSPTHRRVPNYYEKVFVVGFDGEPYLSLETEVQHIGLGGKSFVLRDIPTADRPLVGGMVMGYDCAFLGICGARSVTTPVGVAYPCVTVPLDAPDVPGPRDFLARAFPFLNLEAWPEHLLAEVFTHSSMGKYLHGGTFNAGNRPLASVGDVATKLLLRRDLREHLYPYSKWSVKESDVQSRSFKVSVVRRFDLDKLLVVGPGTSIPDGSKAYSDMLDALLGAAYLVETEQVFARFAYTLGVCDRTSGVVPAASYFSLFGEYGEAREEDGPVTPAVD